MTSPDAAIPEDTPRTISAGMTFLLAAACGLIAANLYYAQPLAGPIRASLGLSPEATGLIVTLTQIGYGLGLLLIVPLGDLLENRRLILTMIGMAALALIAAGLAPTAGAFLAAALLIGLASVAVQIIVPFAAHMAPEAARGQVVGNVMSGLMAGIMLARPVSSFIADILSWRAVFFLSTLVMGLLALVLAGPAFSLSQSGIALFALAGAAGTVAAPIAGRLADRGWSRPATAGAMILGASAFLVTHLVPEGSTLSLGLFVAAAILLDFGATVNIVLGQRAIFALGAESRSRLNGLYMATFFAGGAIGSAAGGWAFAHGGWAWASWAGMALPIAALLYWMTERRG